MGMDLINDLKSKVHGICGQLVNNNQLVTTKTVLSALSKDNYNLADGSMEECIARLINFWRISKLSLGDEIEINKNIDPTKNLHNHHNLYQQNCKYRKQLVNAKREIQFLKAKIKALTSFYNRQRKEFIMRIEGMLYK